MAQTRANLDGVASLLLGGHVDLIAIVRVREFAEIAEVSPVHLQVRGVLNTDPPRVPAYSRHDLEEAFAIGFTALRVTPPSLTRVPSLRSLHRVDHEGKSYRAFLCL